jgi:actin-related protein
LKKQDKKIAIQNIIMDDYVEEKTEKNLISNFIKDNYENFSEMLDITTNKLKRILPKKVELVLFN